MPTWNVNLTDELDTFILERVESGRYKCQRGGACSIANFEREEQRFEAKLAALRDAIDQGDASAVAEGKSFERVRCRQKTASNGNNSFGSAPQGLKPNRLQALYGPAKAVP